MLRLVEETESHVVILLPRILPSFPPSSPRRRPRQERLLQQQQQRHLRWVQRRGLFAGGDNLFDVLAAEFADDLLQAIGIGVNSDGGEDFLQVGLFGGFISYQDSE